MDIDGSVGGGQLLRTALGLSLCPPPLGGRGFRMFNVRAARPRPGLQPQHLAAVRAAAAVGQATVTGDERGSTEITFVPQATRPGRYDFATGTAGSAVLVLQTVLPALAVADAPSRLHIQGGTHNPLAPSFDFLTLAFLPLIERMGPRISARLVRPGFYPAGGGAMTVDVTPADRLRPLELTERGPVLERYAYAWVSHLPRHIAERELAVVGRALDLPAECLQTRVITNALGPGNVVGVVLRSEYMTEVFTGFGERGIPAESIAAGVADAARRYLAAGVPVGEHLADQLLVPVALAGGGRFVTLRPSRHTTSNAALIERFTSKQIECHELGVDRWQIDV